MSLKVRLTYSLLFLVAGLFLTGCATTEQHDNEGNGNDVRPLFRNAFTLPQQKASPPTVQSISLHPKQSPDAPPVIELDTEQRLVLSFDYIGTQAKQFQIKILHRTKDWRQSSLDASQFMKGFDYAYFQSSEQSYSRKTAYQHTEYEFPNNDLKPAVSGNYLLEVYDYDNNNLLFSLPFLVSENEGEIQTKIEQLFVERRDGRTADQPFSTFRYPSFVEQPQFDLSFYYAQNQFWGRTRQTRTFDISDPDRVHFHLPRNKSFLADYGFRFLDLQSFDPDGHRILEYRPETTPPKIILQRDVQNLNADPRRLHRKGLGRSLDDRNSKYAEVIFSLEPAIELDREAAIYIVGHFNNWMISNQNKMRYNPDSGFWEGQALIKQGEYAYKYVKLTDSGIDDLTLDDSFIPASQEYTTFVYYRDPVRYYDRLLQVSHIIR